MAGETKPIGAMAVVVDPRGEICASVSDTNRTSAGGCTLFETQRMRCELMVKGEFARREVGHLFPKMTGYFIDAFWTQARDNGFKIKVLEIVPTDRRS